MAVLVMRTVMLAAFGCRNGHLTDADAWFDRSKMQC